MDQAPIPFIGQFRSDASRGRLARQTGARYPPGVTSAATSESASLRDRLRLALLRRDWVWRMWVRRNFGGRRSPRRKPRWERACAVLEGQAEVDRAVREVEEIGLPAFGALGKFWDGLTALAAILEAAAEDDEVLDAGAELYSPVLPWLAWYGYRRLRGCNLVFGRPRLHGPIVYEHGDITATRYRDGQFAAAACMSVIEHGVDPDRFFAEMARIIRAGGTLVVSTDYWDQPLDAGDRTEFGAPVKVFDRAGARALLGAAAAKGFEPTAPLDLRCGEPVVHWNGLDYTFLVVTLRKKS